MNPNNLIRDLGDGLALRRATPKDAAALGEFNAVVHGVMDENWLDEGARVWTRDLLLRPHPTFHPGDFTIVEETATGRIVSSMNLIDQTWAYGDVTFNVGRPELVGTLPEFRNRGLVRRQFEVVHQWSAERRQLVLGITGIPYYYRLFGYEMTIDLDARRTGYQAQIPHLKPEEPEPYTVRPACETDLPLVTELYAQGSRRYLVRCVWTPELWQYELGGKSPDNISRYELRIIQDAQRQSVGFLAHPICRWGARMAMIAYELKPGISWAAVTPSVARYLEAAGKALSAYKGEHAFGAFSFSLGAEHPAYKVFEQRLPDVNPPYAWYIRVPDLPAFIRHIAPVLEQRLADSAMCGHTGELKLTFYRDGLLLKFEQGKLAEAAPYKPYPVGDSGDAGFPDLTFLQLLFGYRSLTELRYAFADCWADEKARLLLEILFPRLPSMIWPVS
jgi:hypothetical protein